MENQHKKITGYRDLSQSEIDLMNEAKALAETVGAFVAKVSESGMEGEVGHRSRGQSIDMRWLSVGQTHLQQGFMALVRSIARPTTF